MTVQQHDELRIPQPPTVEQVAVLLHAGLCGCSEPENIVHPDYAAMAAAALAAGVKR